MKQLLTSALLLLLVACASDQEQNAFNVIGDYYQSKVSYTKGFSSEIGKKSEKSINLNIKGGPYVSTKKPDQLAVYAAVLLYVNLSNDEANKYTNIRINLFNDEAQKEAFYSRTYDINTIQNIAIQSENFQKAGQLLSNGRPDEVYDLLAEKYRSSQEKEHFVSTLEKMKVERQGVKSTKLIGVELLIDNNTKERYLSFNGDIEWGNATTTDVSVRTFEDANAKGMIHINIK